jgi:hypothetical protein
MGVPGRNAASVVLRDRARASLVDRVRGSLA